MLAYNAIKDVEIGNASRNSVTDTSPSNTNQNEDNDVPPTGLKSSYYLIEKIQKRINKCACTPKTDTDTHLSVERLTNKKASHRGVGHELTKQQNFLIQDAIKNIGLKLA